MTRPSSPQAQLAPKQALDSEALRRFVAVADAGSFTAAATLLRIGQPLLSRSVAALEHELGAPLLVRSSRKLALTPLGVHVVGLARPALASLEDVRHAGRVGEAPIAGPLRLGATDPVASALLPLASHLLLGSQREIHPFIRVATTDALCSAVSDRDLEFVLTFNRPRNPQLMAKPILAVEFALFIAAAAVHSPLACNSFLGSREVEDERERSFPALEQWRKQWPKAKITLSTNSLATQIACVVGGIGIAILPTFVMTDAIAQGKVVRAPRSEAFTFPLLLVKRPGALPSVATTWLSRVVERLGQQAGIGSY